MIRDAAELALAVAVGGMLWAAVTRLRRGQARPRLCPGCGRTVSRVYDACPRCGQDLRPGSRSP
jgi:predicted amidophosphoribosyltransferase